MATSYHRTIATAAVAVHVGMPPLDFQEWEKNEVCFHGFEHLPKEGRESPPFRLLGHKWLLKLFSPREGASEEGEISLFLKNLGNDRVRGGTRIDVEFGFAIKDINDHNIEGGIKTTLTCSFSDQKMIGYPKFIPRQKVTSSLVHGTFVVEVRMKNNVCPPAPFVPENPSACTTIRSLFMDNDSSDVMFEVSGGKLPKDKANNKAMKSSTTFFAHHAIVLKAAPQLAELCKAGKSGSPSLVHIPSVTSDVFRCLLLYIYGFGIPNSCFEVSILKEIIEAADKFGVTSLKLEAEAKYVKSTTVSIDNVMDNLLFAESKVCALLKEAVMDFIVSNKAEILQKKTLLDAPAGHMNDVLAAMTRGEKEGRKYNNTTKLTENGGFGSMRISELRGRAHARGLNVDGTREMLISALEVESGIESNIESSIESRVQIPVANNFYDSDSSDSD